ncbi:hypothetical protein Leryth_001743 [Lithospermum erythrorhizon]|nr:hypothetical protein Leryth_001743 [Lithospermum erythrorhizon]
MAVQVPEVVLNSGKKMPLLGFGTASASKPPNEELISIFLDAIEVGYRHFDTASFYGSEEAVGGAVAAAIERGMIKSRDEIFITTKLWCTDADPHLVMPALENSLKRLGLSYVDLYLIHWPMRMKPGTDVHTFTKQSLIPFDIIGTWKAMEVCCKMGMAKSIGVSNFSCSKLSQILEVATIPPAVNQVEMNVAWQQKKLIEFCKEKKIHVTAYSPLGANGAAWGSLAVMKCPVLIAIASTKQKALAQVALRWVFEQGASVIVKSFNKERMKQNLEILDWELTEEEIAQIQEIPQKRAVSGEEFVDPDGFYKSVDQLWDGEL